MNQSLLVMLSLLPILIIFFFLVIMRWPAKIVMPMAFVAVTISAITVWQVPVNYIVAYATDGLITALGILYIVFGAIMLLNTLNQSGGLSVIRKSFSNLTQDRRIQAIMILWVFGAFLEGAAGFGSTGAVIGPLFVGLGFPAMAAAMVSMVFQSQAVSFGAVGTPILIGLNTGLGQGKLDKVVQTIGDQSWQQYLSGMGFKVAIVHGIVGIFVPLFMAMLLTKFFGKNKSFSEGLAAWKFALFGGICLSIPYVLTARYLGPEFPDIFGGLIGIIPVVYAVKKGWFMPTDGVWDFPPKSQWEKEWIGVLDVTKNEKTSNMSLSKAAFPYILMAIALLASRVSYLPFAKWLTSFDIIFPKLYGTTVSSKFQILYLPGTIFVIVAILTYWLHKMDFPSFKVGVKDATKVMIGAGAALLFAVPTVKIFIGSGVGAAHLLAMPTVLAHSFAALAGNMLVFVAPVVGALGAFIAGSNTLSNMMFSLFQFESAQLIGVYPDWIVVAQCVGAAAGNIICVHNVVMASAAVGLLGREGYILRKVLLPFVYYIVFAGALCYIGINGWGLNPGTIIALGIPTGIFIMIAMRKKVKISYENGRK